MRTCAEYQELISAMLDGELTAEETAEVEAHIAVCEECKAMYEAFAAVSGMETAEVPDTLHEKVMTKVTAAQKAFKTQNNLVRLRPILTTAACLVVVVGTLFAVRGGFRNDSKAKSAAPAASAADTAAGEPRMTMKAVPETAMTPADAPMEAAPAMAAAPAAMAPAAEEAEGFSYAKSAAPEAPAPSPIPEPGAPAEAEQDSAQDCVIVEITFVSDIRIDGVTPEGVPAAVLLEDDTVIGDAVRNALQPGSVISVVYSVSENEDGLVIHAEEIFLAE